MNAIIDAALDRSRAVLTFLTIIIVVGLISYISMPREADPDIPIPWVHVGIVHEGISPADAERLIIKPLETKLRSVDGLKEMKSSALENYASIALEFDVSFDQDQALIDVREKVDQARSELPEDSEEPVVREFNASLFPVIYVNIFGDVSERLKLKLAEALKDDLEALPSILEAEIQGKREELLEVVINPTRMETYRVTQEELYAAVTRNNRLVAAGALNSERGRFTVKIPGLFETQNDVLGLPIKTTDNGVVKLSDIAEIRRTFKDATAYNRLNGKPGLSIAVKKRLGMNVIDVTQATRAVVEAHAATWPTGIEYTYTGDQSHWIYGGVGHLQATVLTAIALVMIIVVAAMGLRSALMVGIAIPTSFLAGFILISALGLTLNMMVMFGLILAVGMLVDGAIVVVELADRKMTEGMDRKQAYGIAAKRMAWPIISSTATTLAVFFPLLFWPGVSGKFMSFLPVTLIIVLSCSLVVALVILPVLGGQFGGITAGANDDTLRALNAAESGDVRQLTGVTGLYARTAYWVAHHPVPVLVLAVGVLFGAVYLFIQNENGVEFFTETEPDFAQVHVQARGNLSAEEARELVTDVEQMLMDVEGVKTVLALSSVNSGGGGNNDKADDEIGIIFVEFTNWQTRKPALQIIDDIRSLTHNIPGIKVEVERDEQGPPVGKDVQIELRSLDLEMMQDVARKIRAKMDGTPALIEITDTLPLPGIDWQLTVDREQAGLFKADITTVGAMVQMVTNGIPLGSYRPDDTDDEVDIRVRYPKEYRSLNQLDELRVQTEGGLIPISNFVQRTPEPKVNKISRVDGERIVEIKANTTKNVMAADMVAHMKEWIEQQDFNPAVDIRFRGANEESDKSGAFLSKALVVSIFLMAIILITQFNSFYYTVLIVSTVILSTVGVLIGMIVMGQAFSVILTGTGIIALAGIVVNNNIVLIDTYANLKKGGMETIEAIVRTGAQRLRPVALTTITTVCGMLPVMFMVNVDFIDREISVGAPFGLWWTQISTAIVFGLSIATVLTLLVTPAALALPDYLRHRRSQLKSIIGGKDQVNDAAAAE